MDSVRLMDSHLNPDVRPEFGSGDHVPLSPLTDTAEVERVKVVQPKAITKRWKSELSIELDPAFEDLAQIEMWRCQRTGLEWYTPASAAGSSDLYEQLGRHDWYYMVDKWEFRIALECLSAGRSMFEIGTGGGDFLAAATEKGLQASGLEWNPSAAEEARRKGFRVFDGTLEKLDRDLYGRFDAVCAFQVLEHVSEPRVFLEEALKLVKPHGTLILSVPNASVMHFIDPQGTNLLDQPPHHMSHWDGVVFDALERILPVKVRETHREPLQLYHVDWFVGSVRRKYRDRFGKLWGRLLFNRVVWDPARWLLKAGLRRFFPGHTLLVVLERVH